VTIELATTVIYADGTHEFIGSTTSTRGSILGNYPLGNPMQGFVIAIEADYNERKLNMEPRLQAELDQFSATYPALVNPTPDAWLERALTVVSAMLNQKNILLKQEVLLTKGAPSLGTLQAMYNANILNDQIGSLQTRLNTLNAEIARRQAEAERQRQAEEARQAEARRQAEELARQQAEAQRKAEEEAKRLAEQKAAEIDYQGALKFTVDFYEKLSENFGARFSASAQELAVEAQGKTIRSAEQGIAAFDKYKDGLNKKFSIQDRAAIASALDSLNHAELGKNLSQFAKGFGYTGKLLDAKDLIVEIKQGYQTGEWSAVFLKVETLALGAAATALLTFVFALTATSGMTILGFSMLVAISGALINDAQVKKLNEAIMAL
jgi:hypothetical protein